jgi:hypothetical protein
MNMYREWKHSYTSFTPGSEILEKREDLILTSYNIQYKQNQKSTRRSITRHPMPLHSEPSTCSAEYGLKSLAPFLGHDFTGHDGVADIFALLPIFLRYIK